MVLEVERGSFVAGSGIAVVDKMELERNMGLAIQSMAAGCIVDVGVS